MSEMDGCEDCRGKERSSESSLGQKDFLDLLQFCSIIKLSELVSENKEVKKIKIKEGIHSAIVFHFCSLLILLMVTLSINKDYEKN